MKGLRILLGVHLAFFVGWAALLLTSHREAREVWLETTPIDPRDILSGHYVALRYTELNVLTAAGCEELADKSELFVHLEPLGNAIDTAHDRQVLWTVVECAEHRPFALTSDAVWMHAVKVIEGSGYHHGIDRFYVGENNTLRDVRSGDVVAQIAINADGDPRVIDLVRILK